MGSRFATFIIDESSDDRSRLHQLLIKHPAIQLEYSVGNLRAALAKMKVRSPDVVFCEADFSDGQLHEFIEEFPPNIQIIITTNNKEFAWRAYDLDAVDFLVKPVSSSRLSQTMRRLLRLDWARPTPPPPESHPIIIPFEGGRKSAMVDEIRFIEACGSYSRAILTTGQSEIVLRSLSRWQQMLPYGSFLRVHRSTLVNRNYIVGLNQHGASSQWHLRVDGLDEPIIVSRRQIPGLKKLLYPTQPGVPA